MQIWSAENKPVDSFSCNNKRNFKDAFIIDHAMKRFDFSGKLITNIKAVLNLKLK